MGGIDGGGQRPRIESLFMIASKKGIRSDCQPYAVAAPAIRIEGRQEAAVVWRGRGRSFGRGGVV